MIHYHDMVKPENHLQEYWGARFYWNLERTKPRYNMKPKRVVVVGDSLYEAKSKWFNNTGKLVSRYDAEMYYFLNQHEAVTWYQATVQEAVNLRIAFLNNEKQNAKKYLDNLYD